MTTNPRRNHDEADSTDDTESKDESEPRAERWPRTPLFSATDIPPGLRPIIQIPEERYYPLLDHGRQRAENGAYGTAINHQKGILGEFSVASHAGVPQAVDTNLYERGDGGFDIRLNGATVDIKSVGRHRSEPALTVDQYQPLEADYYVLANRIGETAFEIVGYAPRHFVANAPLRESDGERFHYVPQEHLFPVPQVLV